MQPQIGTLLRATLSDSDVQVGFGQWKWASSESGLPGTFTDLTAWVDENLNSNANTYRPVDADLSKYLQVSVQYRDKAGGAIRDAQIVSAYTVRKDLVTSNANPQYPDQRILEGGTIIDRGKTRRYIPENSPAGTRVGAPVTAFDDETSIDVITYKLSDNFSANEADPFEDSDDNPATPSETDGDSRGFNIDPATGQIMVAAGVRLNRADDIPADGLDTYAVTVTATDGDGQSEMIAMTITVVKVDEPPSIARVDANTGMVVAPTEMSHYEADRNNSPALEIDTDLDTAITVPIPV